VQILASFAGMKTFWVVGFEIQEERANMVDALAEQEKMETSVVQATNGVCLLCPYYVRLKSEFYL
jgi:galactose-1-phosphate uridylyltransferase